MFFRGSRANYWSSSKLANWLRKVAGYEKPYALTWDEWTDWDNTTETQHPFVYWFTETFLNQVQDIIMFPVDCYQSARAYILNRFIRQTHLIDTKLPKGHWYDADKRLLNGAFETLVDFVEVEKASMLLWSQQPKDQKWMVRYRRWLLFNYRSREDGLAYLDWEASLLEHDRIHRMNQAVVAQEIKDLYLWWKDIRPAREDIWQSIDYDKMSKEEFKRDMERVNKQEELWEIEDEEMLIKLIKLRHNLWT